MLGRGLKLIGVASLLLLTGCQTARFIAYTPNGDKIEVTFYPGSTSAKIPDLMIIAGKNYFGKAGYQMDDALGDLSFRIADGRKIQAECAEEGLNSIDKPQCQVYRIYRSDFELLPVDTIVPRPKGLF